METDMLHHYATKIQGMDKKLVIKKVYGDMDDNEKKDVFKNPSVDWVKYDVFLTTNTTESGVNFDPETDDGKKVCHFDKICGSIGHGCLPRQLNQGLRRVRNPTDHENFYLHNGKYKYDTESECKFVTYEDITDSPEYNVARMQYKDEYSMIDDYLENCKFNEVEDMNKKKNFIRYLELLVRDHRGVFNYIKVDDDGNKLVKTRKYDMEHLMNAKYVADKTEREEIQGRIESSNATEQDKYDNDKTMFMKKYGCTDANAVITETQIKVVNHMSKELLKKVRIDAKKKNGKKKNVEKDEEKNVEKDEENDEENDEEKDEEKVKKKVVKKIAKKNDEKVKKKVVKKVERKNEKKATKNDEKKVTKNDDNTDDDTDNEKIVSKNGAKKVVKKVVKKVAKKDGDTNNDTDDEKNVSKKVVKNGAKKAVKKAAKKDGNMNRNTDSDTDHDTDSNTDHDTDSDTDRNTGHDTDNETDDEKNVLKDAVNNGAKKATMKDIGDNVKDGNNVKDIKDMTFDDYKPIIDKFVKENSVSEDGKDIKKITPDDYKAIVNKFVEENNLTFYTEFVRMYMNLYGRTIVEDFLMLVDPSNAYTEAIEDTNDTNQSAITKVTEKKKARRVVSKKIVDQFKKDVKVRDKSLRDIVKEKKIAAINEILGRYNITDITEKHDLDDLYATINDKSLLIYTSKIADKKVCDDGKMRPILGMLNSLFNPFGLKICSVQNGSEMIKGKQVKKCKYVLVPNDSVITVIERRLHNPHSKIKDKDGILAKYRIAPVAKNVFDLDSESDTESDTESNTKSDTDSDVRSGARPNTKSNAKPNVKSDENSNFKVDVEMNDRALNVTHMKLILCTDEILPVPKTKSKPKQKNKISNRMIAKDNDTLNIKSITFDGASEANIDF